ncbi:MAG: hypothetical protein ACE5KG_07135 [Nitrososphaerales archaeon]
MKSYHVRPPEGVKAWHATRSSLLDRILKEGLKYGSLELFFHCLPISRKPVNVFSGPATGMNLARDVWLEVDLAGSDLLVTGTTNFDFIFEPIEPINPDKIRIMQVDEVLRRADESEWIPCQEDEKEFVFQEEFTVFFSLPILRETGWSEHAIIGRERVPGRLAQLSIGEAWKAANPNLAYWLEVSSMIQRVEKKEIGSYSPVPVPLLQLGR